MSWKPDNWKTLYRGQRQVARKQHRRRILGPIKGKAREWIIDAALLAADTGDEKHDWVVRQLVGLIASLLPFWLGPMVRSWWFRGLLDGLVYDAFEELRKAGTV